MKKLLYLWVPVTLVLMAIGLREALYIAPTEATMGNIQRIFYYHLPIAWLTFLFLFLNLGASIGFLVQRTRNPLAAEKCDAFAQANAEIGTLHCGLTLMLGMLWARPVWGIWWTWDARLTSTLVLFLIYISYLLLRRFSLSGQTSTIAAVLAIFGFADVPIVYGSIQWWRTQHPSPVIGGNGYLDPQMWHAILWNLAGWGAWGLLVMMLRYSGLRAEQEREQRRALAALELGLAADEESAR